MLKNIMKNTTWIFLIFEGSENKKYTTPKKVFEQQYKLNEEKIIITRPNEEITSDSVQSPHDVDAKYRNKNGEDTKGYVVTVSESCDKGSLNLIVANDVSGANTSDESLFQKTIQKSQEITGTKIENSHQDGAYNSPQNQEFAKQNDINMYCHAIQGKQGKYDLTLNEEKLEVADRNTDKKIECVKIEGKNGETKWKIKEEQGKTRYFTKKDIEVCQLRKKIAETPIEILQIRNNVEATIFHFSCRTSGGKTRYRGLIKHQMWTAVRCLWVNCVRIVKFLARNPNFNGHNSQKYFFYAQKLLKNFRFYEKISFSYIFLEIINIFFQKFMFSIKQRSF